MAILSRRQLLQASGLLAAGTALAGCDTAPSGTGADGSKGAVLRWWDHSPNLQQVNRKTWAAFAKAPGGMPVEYQYYQTSKLGQALQLARQSRQLPDIHTNVGLKLPIPALIKDGWYQPVDLDDEAVARVRSKLVEGIHVFGGKVYTFPLFMTKQYWAATWFNTELLDKAGLDPGNPPRTYDEFRAAARAVKKKGDGKIHGWIFNLGFPTRIEEQVGFLAQAAGFLGQSGMEFVSGDIAFHHDAYVAVVEFLLSLHRDGLLVPGSQSFNDDVARARWATGIAAFFFDGPWCAGIVNKDLGRFKDKLGVGPMLVPQAGMEVTAYRPPQGGNYWLSGAAKQVTAANKLLGRCTAEEYAVGIAEGMAQPPEDPGALAKAKVYPQYRTLVDWFNRDVFVAPTPVVRNIDISRVASETKEVKPGLGELVQGMFSGDVPDVRKALKQLSDRTATERERALAAAAKQGAKVTLADYAFSDWQPRTDYGPDKYKK